MRGVFRLNGISVHILVMAHALLSVTCREFPNFDHNPASEAKLDNKNEIGFQHQRYKEVEESHNDDITNVEHSRKCKHQQNFTDGETEENNIQSQDKVTTPCEPDNPCQNGGCCSVNRAPTWRSDFSDTGHPNDTVTCDCSGTWHEGNRCQFAMFPPSCASYRRQGYSVSNVYAIDLDGEGPLQPTNVWCNFEMNQTVTEVRHNIPAGQTVQQNGWGNQRLEINYGHFRDSELLYLVNSKSCKQSIIFKCSNAKLELSGNKTFFSSPMTTSFNSFNTLGIGSCICKDNDACDKDEVSCNCDIGDQKLRRDQALIEDASLLPITSAVFRQTPILGSSSKLQIDLGSLVCTDGVAQATTVALSDIASFLKVAHQGAESLSFAFKTIQRQATVLSAAASDGDLPEYQLALTDGDVLQFRHWSRDMKESSIVFHTSYIINSGQWQFVQIYYSKSQIRVSLNGQRKFINLSHAEKNTEQEIGILYFGTFPSHTESFLQHPGMIGCFTDVRINSTEVLLMIPSVSSATIGCPLSCEPNPCMSGATCTEKYSKGFECTCSDGYAGEKCEAVDTHHEAITFLEAVSGMQLDSFDEPSTVSLNPIVNDVSFIFRTREHQAQLLFAYDNVQNIFMVSLSNPTEISITWNVGFQINNLLLQTGDTKLNRGENVEFQLSRKNLSTDVIIMVNGKKFENSTVGKAQLISPAEYEQFPYGEDLTNTDIPTYQQSKTLPGNFVSVNVGGANGSKLKGRVQGLIGCFNKLIVGNETVDFKHSSIKTTGAVEPGCVSSCSKSQPCQNGGTCLNTYGRSESHHVCDCGTSFFYGVYCNETNDAVVVSSKLSYVYHGNESLVFTLPGKGTESIRRLALEFSFATTASSTAIEETDVRVLLLLRHGLTGATLGVAIAHSSKLLLWETGSASDTTKHALLDQWALGALISSGKTVHIRIEKRVDNVTVRCNEKFSESLLLPTPHLDVFIAERGAIDGTQDNRTFLYLGGIPEDEQIIFTNYVGHTGCISNLTLSQPRNMDEGEQKDGEQYGSLITEQTPHLGLCLAKNINKFSSKDVRIPIRLSPIPPKMSAYETGHTAAANESDVENDQKMADFFDNQTNIYIVAGAGFLIIMIVAMIVIVCVVKRSQRRATQRNCRVSTKAEERDPLNNGS